MRGALSILLVLSFGSLAPSQEPKPDWSKDFARVGGESITREQISARVARGWKADRALSEEVRLRRFGTDCYGYCMVAAGYADLVVESGLQAYDIAPLIPIVERAGGRVTTWDGDPGWNGGRIVASGDPALHEAALAVLSA